MVSMSAVSAGFWAVCRACVGLASAYRSLARSAAGGARLRERLLGGVRQVRVGGLDGVCELGWSKVRDEMVDNARHGGERSTGLRGGHRMNQRGAHLEHLD